MHDKILFNALTRDRNRLVKYIKDILKIEYTNKLTICSILFYLDMSLIKGLRILTKLLLKH